MPNVSQRRVSIPNASRTISIKKKIQLNTFKPGDVVKRKPEFCNGVFLSNKNRRFIVSESREDQIEIRMLLHNDDKRGTYFGLWSAYKFELVQGKGGKPSWL